MERLLIVFGFFCGAIPFGFLAGKLKGIDIRAVGSGNIGATNVFRTLGKKWGVAVFAADILKGFLPVFATLHIKENSASQDMWLVLVGIAAVLGHNFTPFLKFKGGKGVATSTGVLLGLMPLSLGISAVVWGMVFGIGRYVSLASLAAAVALPIATCLFYPQRMWFIIVAAALGILAIVRHRSNISRLVRGEESRFGRKKT